MTYDFLLPIRDQNGKFVSYKLIARGMASKQEDAEKFAAEKYGPNVVVKPTN